MPTINDMADVLLVVGKEEALKMIASTVTEPSERLDVLVEVEDLARTNKVMRDLARDISDVLAGKVLEDGPLFDLAKVVEERREAEEAKIWVKGSSLDSGHPDKREKYWFGGTRS